MTRPRCQHGTYDPPGEVLPTSCRYRRKPTFKAIGTCGKCILYRAVEEVPKAKPRKGYAKEGTA